MTSIYKFLSDITTIFRGSSKRFADFEDDNDEEEICECNLCNTFRQFIDFITKPFRKYKNI